MTPGTARWREISVYLSYAVLAFWVTVRLWRDPVRRIPDGGQGGNEDHRLFEWNLAYAVRALRHLDNPFFSHLQNVPDGVNLMANTSMLGLGLPLAPVTWLAGPTVTYHLIIWFSLFASAAAWYVVFSRYLVSSRLAAAIGAGLCGFAPGMVAHARGHLHIIAQFLIPVIIALALRLREPGRLVRRAVVLGVLAAWQIFLGEEMLFLFAVGLGVFLLSYALQRPGQARAAVPRTLLGLLIAVGTAGVFVAYPLWLQFAGPQSYHTVPGMATVGADLASYPATPQLTLAGSAQANARLALNPAEENSFFSVPLLVLALVTVAWLWRSALVRAVSVTAAVLGVLSLGPTLTIRGQDTGVPLPWRAFAGLPLFDSAVPARFALVVAVALGVLMAMAVDAAMAADRVGFRPVALALVAAALLPLIPTPLPVIPVARDPVPAFVTSGEWHRYVRDGRTLVPVPVPGIRDASGLRWPAAVGAAFAVPGGYFIGPGPDGRGQFGPVPGPTYRLLDGVAATGQPPVVTEADRQYARADLRYWRADAVVLGPHQHEAALRSTVDALLGPGRRIGDVWLWEVRDD